MYKLGCTLWRAIDIMLPGHHLPTSDVRAKSFLLGRWPPLSSVAPNQYTCIHDVFALTGSDTARNGWGSHKSTQTKKTLCRQSEYVRSCQCGLLETKFIGVVINPRKSRIESPSLYVQISEPNGPSPAQLALAKPGLDAVAHSTILKS